MKKHLKDYFIPHEGNDYRPHSLQKIAVAVMACLVLLSFVATNTQALLWQGSDWLISTVLPAVIIDLTNDERSDEALVSLQRNTILDAAASLKAQHMAREEYFAHFAPDGTSPWYFFNQVDYNFVHAGENLAIHFTDSSEVVGAWMESPTHRANILNGNYTEIGVGTAKGEFEGYETIYVVQLFGTPSAAPAVAGVDTTPEPVVETVVTESEPLAVAETETEPEPTVAEDDSEVLAEAVQIIETVDVIEPEPEPVTVTEIVEVEPVATATEPELETEPVTVYSGFISTSTGGVPASIDPVSDTTTQSNWLADAVTQPQFVLQVLYSILALFVVGILLLSILVEIQRQQPVQIAYSLALLVLMYGLFKLHVTLGSGAVVV